MKEKFRNRLNFIFIIVSLVDPLLFWLVLIISGFLHPEYDPIQQSISYLALGPFGWLQRANIFVFGLTMVCFGIALHASIRHSRRSNIVLGLFIFIGIGQIFSSIFQSDFPPTSDISLHALIHQAGASVAAIAFPVSAFILQAIYKKDADWRGLSKYTLICGAVILGLALVREVLLPTHSLDPWFGLFERILIVILLAWVEVIAVRLWQIYHKTSLEAKK